MNKESVYDKLAALKKRLAPTDRARKIELARTYQSLKRPPRQMPVERWLQQWEKIYTDAKKLELPEVQDDRPLYDFLLVIKSLEPTFAVTHEVLIAQKTKEDQDLLTLYNLVEDFRNHRCITQTTTTKPSHSAFATFQGETASSNVRKPCVCGDMHLFRQCPYLIEFRQLTDWKPDPKVQRQIDEALEKSAKLRASVGRARRWAEHNKNNVDSSDINNRPSSTERSTLSASSNAPTPSNTIGSFAVYDSTNDFRIQNCWVLDSAANVHVCNN